MSSEIDSTSIKWAAQLQHVKEVSLLGTADYAFWKEYLKEENLQPAEHDGKAHVMIIAADAKYMNIRFREVSFSVEVLPPKGCETQDAAYLVHAYNSNRFFSFCERTFFSTPYDHANVDLSVANAVEIQVAKEGIVAFAAKMNQDDPAFRRNPRSSEEAGWKGSIYLPSRGGVNHGPGKFFYARLNGYTKTYPFLPDKDIVTMKHLSNNKTLSALSESHFVGLEWCVREDAQHEKSKTYRRCLTF
ncbi:hypothetical protein [Bythopirellula polymerisocia]|uniref:Uncharacterized protein n=1 Tax=Bythopirellula polymerisocia TaxID=2528003 RepID=A0A5C6D141_9BACT|nr:hypothetical protein [Bythopirellula polymerisocia]TWU30448.1 hypothetical protein Pla144_12350 [Bythopirellula polymerisocia]